MKRPSSPKTSSVRLGDTEAAAREMARETGLSLNEVLRRSVRFAMCVLKDPAKYRAFMHGTKRPRHAKAEMIAEMRPALVAAIRQAIKHGIITAKDAEQWISRAVGKATRKATAGRR